MFTGIIESLGTIDRVSAEGSNKHFYITAPFTHELKVDQSVAHNGVCLTVVEIDGDRYKVTAIAETLAKTNLNDARTGDLVNLERCMPANGRFDGHIVQGHVDTTAICDTVEEQNGSWIFSFNVEGFDPFSGLIVSKGSICINGISLTVVETKENRFSVAIIPYTYEHTNLHMIKTGDRVNIEFDVIGKYIKNMLNRQLS